MELACQVSVQLPSQLLKEWGTFVCICRASLLDRMSPSPACFSAFCSLRNRKTCFPAFSILNGLVLQGKTSPLNTPKAAQKARETKAGPQYPLAAAEGWPQVCALYPFALAEEKGKIRKPQSQRGSEVVCQSTVHWSPLRTPETQTGHCWIKDGIRKRQRHREVLSRKHRSTGDSLSTPELQGPGNKEKAAIESGRHIYRVKVWKEDQGQKDQT